MMEHSGALCVRDPLPACGRRRCGAASQRRGPRGNAHDAAERGARPPAGGAAAAAALRLPDEGCELVHGLALHGVARQHAADGVPVHDGLDALLQLLYSLRLQRGHPSFLTEGAEQLAGTEPAPLGAVPVAEPGLGLTQWRCCPPAASRLQLVLVAAYP